MYGLALFAIWYSDGSHITVWANDWITARDTGRRYKNKRKITRVEKVEG